MSTTSTPSTAVGGSRRQMALTALSAPIHPRTLRELLHVLLDFPVGVAGFAFVITFLLTGLGLAITIVGIPLLAAMVLACRAIAGLERARARALLAERVAHPPAFQPDQRGFLGWLKAALLDGPGWRGAIYLLLLFPWGTATFATVGSLLMWAAVLIAYPVWLPFVDDDGGININGHLVRAPWEVALAVLAGVVIVFLVPWLVRGLAVIDRTMVRSLLGPWTLAHRVRHLEVSREQALDTAAADLRRIERDLHDGAQARLVALAMDLGMAKERMARDPAAAEALIAKAHDETKQVLAELHDIARGIYPAILTERGLDAALSAIAARCAVPVTVSVDLPARPSPAVEAVAYYSASELLANVSRHSGAAGAELSARRVGDRLVIVVQDNGRGGADPGGGTGLAGLTERIHSVDGRFHLVSPTGGPTVATVELPWSP